MILLSRISFCEHCGLKAQQLIAQGNALISMGSIHTQGQKHYYTVSYCVLHCLTVLFVRLG